MEWGGGTDIVWDLMNKASLIARSGASWAETWRKGEHEPCGHLRKCFRSREQSVQGPYGSNMPGVCKNSQEANVAGMGVHASTRMGKNTREVAKAKALLSEWPGSWRKHSERTEPCWVLLWHGIQSMHLIYLLSLVFEPPSSSLHYDHHRSLHYGFPPPLQKWILVFTEWLKHQTLVSYWTQVGMGTAWLPLAGPC